MRAIVLIAWLLDYFGSVRDSDDDSNPNEIDGDEGNAPAIFWDAIFSAFVVSHVITSA